MHFLNDRLLNMMVEGYARVRTEDGSGVIQQWRDKKGAFRYVFVKDV